MKLPLKPWVLAASAVCVSALAVGGLYYYRHLRRLDTSELIARFPSSNAPLVYVDVAALRTAGLLRLLAEPAVNQEPEYRRFVGATGFDYTQDLDALLISLDGSHRYFLARGRFDWKRLRAYAIDSGGSCLNGFCVMAGSAPERKISFFSLRHDVLALAVSPEPKKAALMFESGAMSSSEIPVSPLWVSFPYPQAQQLDGMPAGLSAFLSALRGADRITLWMNAALPNAEIRLAARTSSPQDAERIRSRLEILTATLNSWIAREGKTPNPEDLSGVLTAGRFWTQSSMVEGAWPVTPKFIRSLFGPR